MKSYRPYALACSAAILLGGSFTAQSAPKTWDGEGANGFWSASPANWDLDTAPVAGDSLSFGGLLNVTNTNDFAANTLFAGITFNSGAGTFVLNGAAIDLGGNVTNNSTSLQTINLGLAQTAARTFTTSASGGDLKLGGALTGAFRPTFAGAGTTTLTGSGSSVLGISVRGTLVLDSGATLNAGSQFNSIGTATGDASVFTIKGTGSFTTTAELALADTGATNPAITSGTLNVQDTGSVTAIRLVVGKGGNNTGATGTGVANQTGGTVTLTGTAAGDGLLLGGRSGTNTATNGTYNLNGGTLNTFQVRFNTLGTGVLNFDGGRLQAAATNATFIASNANLTARVKAGGGTIDSNGFNVTISQALIHDAALGTTTDGGITKTGTGILTLSGTNTYTGATNVSAGTVLVSGSINGTTVVTASVGGEIQLGGINKVADGAPVDLAGGTFNTAGFSETVGTLSLSSGVTSTINLGGGASIFHFSDSSGQTWNGTLAITNWSGSTSGGGIDQLFFGSAASGLVPAQIAAVQFINPAGFGAGTYGAQILPTGELVAIPEPSAAVSLLGGMSCLLGLQRVRRRLA